uniref:HTH lysR-type domain-containing protein n=1 Tax=Onchocerca flexuosa TaxID=387005 RepID=A0A183HQC8_9BILA
LQVDFRLNITKGGQQLANKLVKEFDQFEDLIQQNLENIMNHWKLITIVSCLYQFLSCRQNPRSKNIIILPTNSIEIHTLNDTTRSPVIKLDTFPYTPQNTSFQHSSGFLLRTPHFNILPDFFLSPPFESIANSDIAKLQ